VASVAVSVAAAAGTAPLTLLHFQRVHPLGPLWNLLAYPLTAIPLAGGFASLVLGALHPRLGHPIAWLVDGASSLLLAPLLAGARLPGSSVFVPPPHAVLALAAYALLAAGLVPRWRRAVLLCGLAACPAIVLAAAVLPRRPEAWTFAVGAGDAALLRIPGAGSFLIDAGAPGAERDAAANLARATLSSGTRALAGVFITHAHADHLRGFRGLSRRLPVAGLWTAPGCEASAAGAAVIAEALAAGVPRREAVAGIRLRFPRAPGFSLEVIHPLADESLPLARSANDSSLALRVAMDGSALLFLGDLEEDGLARLFSSRRELRADVLVSPHHGRPNRLWPLLLERVQPRAVIISGNGDGGARELAAATEAAGIPVFATFEGGAVRTVWDSATGWTPRYWRAPAAGKR
jgi:competence protein ComEC